MKKAIGWVLVGLGVVAVGYLGWESHYGIKAYYHWYWLSYYGLEIKPEFLRSPWQPWLPYLWLKTGTSLVAGVLLLVFGIRMLMRAKV